MLTQKLLNKAGDRHFFQIYSIIFVCLKWMLVSLTVFLPSYLLMTPTFTCGNDANVIEADACVKISMCTINQKFTITNYADLYCDNRYVRSAIISSQFIGSVVGLILLSILADKLGRKIIIVSTLYCTLFGTIVLTIGTYYKVYALMFIGNIAMGFGGYSLTMVAYSYISEVNNDLWRQKGLVLTYSFWAIGEIMLYFIITYIQDWLLICFWIFIVPLIVLTLMSSLIVQTPQFLYTKKRYEECLVSLNYIAKFNGKPRLESLGQIIIPDEEPEQLQDTFLKMKYLLPLIVLSFAQVCNNAYYYTAQYSIDEYGYRFEINMLVIGCLELGSCIFTNFFCDKMLRKTWIIIFMVSSGVFGVLIQVTGVASVFELILLGGSRLFNTVAFALFSLICSESFPTSIKSTGMGITEAMSNLGNMGAPFFVMLAQDMGVRPVLIGGIINIVGGISMLAVKQTKILKAKDNEINSSPDIRQTLLTKQEQAKQPSQRKSKSQSGSGGSGVSGSGDSSSGIKSGSSSGSQSDGEANEKKIVAQS